MNRRPEHYIKRVISSDGVTTWKCFSSWDAPSDGRRYRIERGHITVYTDIKQAQRWARRYKVDFTVYQDGPCDRCKKTAQLIDYCDTLDPADTESLCDNCYQKRTGTGAYDPENRDWDSVRDEQDGY